jgi:hypothetical protein
VKVFVTEIEYEVDLDHLLTDGEEVPQSQNETEMEWVLLQSPPTCDGDTCVEIAFNNSENELAVEQEAGDASKTIIRRYEFYEYAGEVNAEDNEAQPNSVMAGCEGNPVGCDIVGNYLGAQMAAAVLGLGDSLQLATQSPVMGGATGVNYLLMLTAVGGVAPYSWSLSSGALFSGLGITIDGWITGVPTESGTRTFDITVEDFNQDSVTKSVTLTIVGPSSTTTEAATTVAPGTTEGTQAATTTDSVTTKTIEAPSSTTTEAATTASPGTTEGTQATTTTDSVTTEAPPTSDWSSLLSSLDVSCLVPDDEECLNSRLGILDVDWTTEIGGGTSGGDLINALIVGEPSSNSDCICENCCEEFGDPEWVKSCFTEADYAVSLDDLYTDGPEVPQAENQCQWLFVQAPPTCDEDCYQKSSNSGRTISLDIEPDVDTASVVSRFEFYAFTGEFSDWNEADPKNEDEPTPGEIGNYFGAYMAAVVR